MSTLETLQTLLARPLLGRPLSAYLLALGILAGVALLARVLERLLTARLRGKAHRAPGDGDDPLVASLHRAAPTIGWLLAVWLSVRQLNLPSRADNLVSDALLAVAVFVGARALLDLVTHGFHGYFAHRYGADDRRAQVLRPILSVVIWGIAVVFILDNLGVKVSTVLAGLGIGGIAVALAAQAVLSDLFAYVAIVFDRPFAIGDFIIVDTLMGTVEHIGIKTTRVRSLGGELLVFGNANLLGTRLRNFRPLEKRRVLFGFGLAYASPIKEVAAVPGLIKEIVTAIEGVTFDRAHFKSFGDSCLTFEVVYWVLSPDYNRYMDIQQSINLTLMERLAERGLTFAYPTRTIHVSSLPKNAT